MRLSGWRGHEAMGCVRDLSFVTPIKGTFASWGAPQAQCYQTQRYVVYKGDHLVFETSQVRYTEELVRYITVHLHLSLL